MAPSRCIWMDRCSSDKCMLDQTLCCRGTSKNLYERDLLLNFWKHDSISSDEAILCLFHTWWNPHAVKIGEYFVGLRQTYHVQDSIQPSAIYLTHSGTLRAPLYYLIPLLSLNVRRRRFMGPQRLLQCFGLAQTNKTSQSTSSIYESSSFQPTFQSRPLTHLRIFSVSFNSHSRA